jgi:hypothetical protein
LGYPERWRRVGRDRAARSTQGVVLICGSKTAVGNIRDPSAMAAMLEHLQASGWLLANIIVLYDDTWATDNRRIRWPGRGLRRNGLSLFTGFLWRRE